jgi:low affinity Fe/Cu permease
MRPGGLGMGRFRPVLSLLRDVATRHQHQHDDSYFPHGFFDSEHQNRDGAAIQAKLDELIRSGEAKNAFIALSI